MFRRLVQLSEERKNPALWIILIYGALTGAWILFSDELVSHVGTVETVIHISTIKGWLFTGITAIILYMLIKRSFSEIVVSHQKLETSEKQLHLLINSIPALISYVDSECRYIWVNRGYEKLLGKNTEDISGRHVGDVLGADSWAKIRPYVERALAGEHVSFENTLAWPGGDTMTVWATYTPDYDADGHVRGFVVLVRDITKQKKDEQSLITYNRRLIELEEELRKKLAAELHDELGPDLTSLSFTLSLAHHCPIAPPECQFLSHLEDAEHRLENMSSTVRTIIAGLRPPVLEDYGLEQALLWQVKKMAKQTDIALLMRSEGTFPRLPPDRELALFRIAHEALVNAIKYSKANLVSVTLDCTDNTIRLSVCDDGVGFVPPTGLSPGTDSWGLGIMRERTEMLGGTFLLETAAGTGTKISLEIPRESTGVD